MDKVPRAVNPAYCSEVQQSDELRAVGDFKRKRLRTRRQMRRPLGTRRYATPFGAILRSYLSRPRGDSAPLAIAKAIAPLASVSGGRRAV